MPVDCALVAGQPGGGRREEGTVSKRTHHRKAHAVLHGHHHLHLTHIAAALKVHPVTTYVRGFGVVVALAVGALGVFFIVAFVLVAGRVVLFDLRSVLGLVREHYVC